MTILGRAKHSIVHLMHQGIIRFWVQPLESQIVPRLAAARRTRLHSLLLKWALWCANVGRAAVMDVRVIVNRWSGPDWSATYIGEGTSVEVIRHILFPSPPVVNELPRVSLWQVPALVRKFAREGVVVVCELNEIIHWSPTDL